MRLGHVLDLSFDDFTFGCAPTELVGQPLSRGSERKAHGIDAIALAGWRRAVGKDVALVRPAACADDLRAYHSVTRVADGPEVTVGKGLGEARPARAALELGAAVEERKPAEPAGEDSRALFVQEDAT